MIKVRKIVFMISIGVGMLLTVPKSAQAANTVKINKTNFPDKNFRYYVSYSYDKNRDGKLSKKERNKVKVMKINSIKGVKSTSISLKGIQYFTNLQRITISKYGVKKPSFRKLKKLIEIDVATRGEIDISDNKKLEKLDIYISDCKKVDLRNNPNLKEIRIEEPQKGKKRLEKVLVNAKTNPKVKKMYFSGLQKVKEFDINNMKHLKELYFVKTNRKLIPKTKLNALTKLFIVKCNVRSLSCKKFPNLTKLSMSGSSVKKLDVSKNKKLKYLNINCTHISSQKNLKSNKGIEILEMAFTGWGKLDISKYRKLRKLYAPGNYIRKLDASKAPNLEDLELTESYIPKLDLSKNKKLKSLGIGVDHELSKLILPKNGIIEKLMLYEINITSLNVKNYKKLKEFSADHTLLSDLQISGCKNLSSFSAEESRIKKLDLSGCFNLVELYVASNQIEQIDLSDCSKLMHIEIGNNFLENLDVSNCPDLLKILAGGNRIKEIDVSNCLKLTLLLLRRNSLSKLDVTNCRKLTKLDVSYNKLSQLVGVECLELEYLNARYNQLKELNISKVKIAIDPNNNDTQCAICGNPLSKIYVRKSITDKELELIEREVYVTEPEIIYI